MKWCLLQKGTSCGPNCLFLREWDRTAHWIKLSQASKSIDSESINHLAGFSTNKDKEGKNESQKKREKNKVGDGVSLSGFCGVLSCKYLHC